MHGDLDILLPKMGVARATELFFILAVTGEIGGEAIAKRIQERMVEYEHAQQAGLTTSTSYHVEAIQRHSSQSMEEFVDKVANQIQVLMDGEISSRMVNSGQ